MKQFWADPVIKVFSGFLLGWAVTGGVTYCHHPEIFTSDQAEMQRELTAYRHCLLAAGMNRCKMTPQDFVRYYELKYSLEAK